MSDTDRLIDRLSGYGADMEGTMVRFLEDREMYAECFGMFLADPGFEALDRALAAADYRRAFEAAHTLKGVSANLGLTPFYHAVYDLVEELRQGRTDRLAERYAALRAQYAVLQKLA